MTARRRPEDIIQRAVVQHLTWRCTPGVFAFHCPNGGARSAIEAAILKGLGVVAGVPDIIVIKTGHAFALELKAPGGQTSDQQNDAIDAMRIAGASVAIADGLDAALTQLETWGILRRSGVRQ